MNKNIRTEVELSIEYQLPVGRIESETETKPRTQTSSDLGPRSTLYRALYTVRSTQYTGRLQYDQEKYAINEISLRQNLRFQ